MIIGIGTDIIRIKRFENKDDYFYNKIFTKDEQDYFKQKSYSLQTVAGLFAAKEAFLKTMGSGIAKGFGLLDIEILHDNLSRPYYNINQKILDYINHISNTFIKKENINTNLSISHDGEYACAFAIIEIV